MRENLFDTRDGIGIKEIINEKDWKDIIFNVSYYTIDYSFSYIELCNLVMNSKCDDIKTFKLAFFQQNDIVALWTFQVRACRGYYEVGSNEGEVIPPIFVCGISKKTQKKIIDRCINILYSICDQYNITEFKSVCPIRNNGVTLWQHKLLDANDLESNIISLRHQLFVNLNYSEQDIISNYRKSYKPLINSNRNKYKIVIYNRISYDIMNEFREFHIKVKGKSTRSLETWIIQADAINKGEAFLVLLYDDTQTICGGGIFLFTPFESYYNSAAYSKEMHNQPLGHIVQHTAIMYAKSRGLYWHRVGERYYKNDNSCPSNKELQISHFKEGFSTNTFIDIIINCRVK